MDVPGKNRREGGVASTPFATPWGPGELLVFQGRLVEVIMPDLDRGDGSPGTASDAECSSHPESAVECAPAGGNGRPVSVADRRCGEYWRGELEEYFRNPARRWTAEDVGLQSLPVSAFRRDVYRTLLTVPAGETVSYGELARLAGHPGAARAVGSAMAQNPLPVLVPCHRVVRGDGSLGRYGTCDALKGELLRLEGALPGKDEEA